MSRWAKRLDEGLQMINPLELKASEQELPPFPPHDSWITDIDGRENQAWGEQSMDAYGHACRAPLLAEITKRDAELLHSKSCLDAAAAEIERLKDLLGPDSIDPSNAPTREQYRQRAEAAERERNSAENRIVDLACERDELRAQLEAAQKGTNLLNHPLCPTCGKPCETFSTTGCIEGQQYMAPRAFVWMGDKTYHLGCEPRYTVTTRAEKPVVTEHSMQRACHKPTDPIDAVGNPRPWGE